MKVFHPKFWKKKELFYDQSICLRSSLKCMFKKKSFKANLTFRDKVKFISSLLYGENLIDTEKANTLPLSIFLTLS